MNLFTILTRQMRWSNNTFGVGPRLKGNIEHLRQEIAEVEANPTDPMEYADVILLAADTAMRQGITPHALCKAIEEKQQINFTRQWNLQGDDLPPRHKCEPSAHDWVKSPAGPRVFCRLCGQDRWDGL